MERDKEFHTVRPACADTNIRANTYSHGDTYTDSIRDADPNADADADSYTHTYSDTDINTHTHTVSYANSDLYAYRYSWVNAYSKFHMGLYVSFYHCERAIAGISGGRQCCEQQRTIIPVERYRKE